MYLHTYMQSRYAYHRKASTYSCTDKTLFSNSNDRLIQTILTYIYYIYIFYMSCSYPTKLCSPTTKWRYYLYRPVQEFKFLHQVATLSGWTWSGMQPVITRPPPHHPPPWIRNSQTFYFPRFRRRYDWAIKNDLLKLRWIKSCRRH